MALKQRHGSCLGQTFPISQGCHWDVNEVAGEAGWEKSKWLLFPSSPALMYLPSPSPPAQRPIPLQWHASEKKIPSKVLLPRVGRQP